MGWAALKNSHVVRASYSFADDEPAGLKQGEVSSARLEPALFYCAQVRSSDLAPFDRPVCGCAQRLGLAHRHKGPIT